MCCQYSTPFRVCQGRHRKIPLGWRRRHVPRNPGRYGKQLQNGQKSTANRLKRFIANRAVTVTAVTLLLAVGVIVAVTAAASRSRKPNRRRTGNGRLSGNRPSNRNRGRQTGHERGGNQSQLQLLRRLSGCFCSAGGRAACFITCFRRSGARMRLVRNGFRRACSTSGKCEQEKRAQNKCKCPRHTDRPISYACFMAGEMLISPF